MNQVVEQTFTPWAVYGSHTGIHIFPSWNRLPITPAGFDPLTMRYADLKVPRGLQTVTKLLRTMRTHGLDLSPRPGRPVPAAHGPAALDATLAALRASLDDLRAEGEIAPS